MDSVKEVQALLDLNLRVAQHTDRVEVNTHAKRHSQVV
jgi:hypothetical protein